ncbi:hypothetical protein TBLA_0A01340 [Henningerozyma blattae CBS 6284]|uniref:Enhancer of mRNA-decapping protein 3 n=1 Tax=Henningerozyma blattae (strain ATCC 34711 / CBS 6284 / DSM 70876 / NBRC 10599 / NRRL Y-10934 / UCD 77-7) TaxID=1071380 RepID=I2GUY1_HENB6|nr:hypothetical protein TBLA_0A01340 [Tetrapisispora blattae CBS 6284]CCH57933.1 hypothetical protein TBLA_0A01340 [Tetrapisispora blattae CBS 6284]
MSQFVGFGVQLELKDGKLIQGKIAKVTSKGLTLHDVKFGDGGTSQAFKVRASRLKDLEVLNVPKKHHMFFQQSSDNENNNTNSNSNTDANNSSNNNGSNVTSNNSNSYGNGSHRYDGKTNSNIDWQNDDVSKIKMQDDFDFQGNLRMFNKKDVFAQLKQNDSIKPTDRLVSHNKLNKDGNDHSPTNNNDNSNKTKFDNDELVLPNAKSDIWDKISSNHTTLASTTAPNTVSNKELLKEVSGTKQRKSVGSSLSSGSSDNEFEEVDENGAYLPITKSINITHLLHTANSPILKDGHKNTKHKNGDIMDKLEKMIINQSGNYGASRKGSANQPAYPTYFKTKDIPNLTIPLATPIQLLEIERIALENFKINTNIMLENFAINASYFIKQKLGGRTRLHQNNSNPEPLVVILTSDSNRVGTRALALGRHLCQSGQVRVMVLFANSPSLVDIQDTQIKEQLELFKNCGGKVVNNLSTLKNTVAQLNSPVEIVIDAIQGFDGNLNDLVDNDNVPQNNLQSNGSNNDSNSHINSKEIISATESHILSVIEWCNQQHDQNRKIWSLDLSSGFDTGSGFQNFKDVVNSTGIICSGWPLYLLNSLKDNLSSLHEVVMIDMGTPKAVYAQKPSLRKFMLCDAFVTDGSITLTLPA